MDTNNFVVGKEFLTVEQIRKLREFSEEYEFHGSWVVESDYYFQGNIHDYDVSMVLDYLSSIGVEEDIISLIRGD